MNHANRDRSERAADFYATGKRFLAWQRSKLPAWKAALVAFVEDDWFRWCVEKEGLDPGPFARKPSPGERPIPPTA